MTKVFFLCVALSLSYTAHGQLVDPCDVMKAKPGMQRGIYEASILCGGEPRFNVELVAELVLASKQVLASTRAVRSELSSGQAALREAVKSLKTTVDSSNLVVETRK